MGIEIGVEIEQMKQVGRTLHNFNSTCALGFPSWKFLFENFEFNQLLAVRDASTVSKLCLSIISSVSICVWAIFPISKRKKKSRLIRFISFLLVLFFVFFFGGFLVSPVEYLKIRQKIFNLKVRWSAWLLLPCNSRCTRLVFFFLLCPRTLRTWFLEPIEFWINFRWTFGMETDPKMSWLTVFLILLIEG